MSRLTKTDSKFFNESEDHANASSSATSNGFIVPIRTGDTDSTRRSFGKKKTLTVGSMENAPKSDTSPKKNPPTSSPTNDSLGYFDKIISRGEEGEKKTGDKWLVRFNLTVGFVIFTNSIVIAVETDHKPTGNDAATEIYGAIEHFFVIFFTLELLIRLKMEGIMYFVSGWNWLDFVCVLGSIVDVWLIPLFSGGDAPALRSLSILRMLRLVRVVRLLRLFKMFEDLHIIISSFAASLKSIFWVAILVFLGMFICSILTTQLIGQNSYFADVKIEGDDITTRFGTVPKSMFSLFELLLLEGWNAVGRPLIQRSPFMILFFLVFIMVFTFGLLNMIVGMVVEQTIEHSKMNDLAIQKQNEQEMKNMVMSFKDFFETADTDGNGELTYEEFQEAVLSNPELVSTLEDIDIPSDQWRDLFHVLDSDGDGKLTAKEFLAGVIRVRGAARNRDLVSTHMTVTRLLNQQKSLLAEVKDAKKSGEFAMERLDAIEAMVVGQTMPKEPTATQL